MLITKKMILFISVSILLLSSVVVHAATVTTNYTYDNIGRLVSTSYTNAAGVSSISYNYDSAGNILASTSSGLADTTPPVISLNGSSSLTVSAGTTYVDAKATVTDNVGVTNKALAGASKVNTSLPGTYTVTYNASDAAGNAAIQVTRTVKVVSTLAIRDGRGNALTGVQQVNTGNTLTIKRAGGSGNVTASVSGPNGYNSTLSVDSAGRYTFKAPATGAFAGDYTLALTDSVTGVSTSTTIRVPLQVRASRLNILESDRTQTVTITGGAPNDVFSVVVLNPLKLNAQGKALPDTNVNQIAANITNVSAVNNAANGNPATAIIIPVNVSTIHPFFIRVKKTTQVSLATITSRRMHIVPESTVALTVTDVQTNQLIAGAKVVLQIAAPIIAASNITTTTNTSGVAAPTLPFGTHKFEVSAAGHLPTVVTLAQGVTSGAVALTPITAPVIFTGNIAVATGYSLAAKTRVLAVNASGEVVSTTSGTASTFSLTLDANVFTPIRLIAKSPGAITDIKTTIPAGGGFIGTFTLRPKAQLISLAKLTSDVGTGSAGANAGSLVYTGKVAFTGVSGATQMFVLAKPTVTKGVPTTGSVMVRGHTPVIQVLKNAGGSIISAPVAYQALSDAWTGAERRQMAGTQPVTVDDTTVTSFTIPNVNTISNVKIHLPVDAFKSFDANNVPVVVKDIFTTVSGVKAVTAIAQSKAKLTGGEIVEIDMTAFDANGNVLGTGLGNSNLGKGMEVRIPIDSAALIAAGSSAANANADFASGKLAIYTAPTIADFEAGINFTVVSGTVTYDPVSGDAMFYVNHFSAFGAGRGSSSSGSSSRGSSGASSSGGGCVLASSHFDPIFILLLLVAVGYLTRQRCRRQWV